MAAFRQIAGIDSLSYKQMYYCLLPADYSLPKDRWIAPITKDDCADYLGLHRYG